MVHYLCFVQEGQVADRRRDELAAGLARLGRETFGDTPDGVEIRWTAVPAGFGFTAGEPSTASLVVRSVPVGWGDTPRAAFMRAVCDLWRAVTGCSADEIMVTAFDGPLPV